MLLANKGIYCAGLIYKLIKAVDEIFIPAFLGLNGEMGDLIIDPNYALPTTNITIDSFVATHFDLVKQ
eukprot:2328891-Ditylum_brightwellii.AAC.1